jgi:hypothetical protein
VPPQHRTPRPAWLILAFTSLVVLSPFVVVSGGDSTGAAPVSTQQPVGGQPATAGAAAIVNFEDLIRQDLRHPRASPTVRARAQTDTNEPRENHEQAPTYASKLTAPTLALSNTGDQRVPITESFMLYHVLRDHGVKTKFIAYPVSGHSPDDPIHQRDIDRRWPEWIQTHFESSNGTP